MRTTFAHLAGAFALAAAAGSAAPAAAATEVFDFAGACADCYGGTGTATAQLTLHDYAYGDNISGANFTSFHYDRTDLLAGYTIEGDEAAYLAGQIFGPKAAPASFSIFGANHYFSASGGGYWGTGQARELDDFGFNHSFAAAPAVSAVPEPATWGLAIMGLGVAGAVRRRRVGAGRIAAHA